MGYTPHVLVVGGGATGTGVARDLAMRGLDVTLVDRGTLSSGASGSMQAMLHSGARFAGDDPDLAGRCRRESSVLRAIGGHLVVDADGIYAELPGDPAEFVEEKRSACEAVDIQTRELSGEEAREYEPALAADVERVLGVPDAAIDPFRFCLANARAAVDHGAEIRTRTRVSGIQREDDRVGTVRLVNEDDDVPALSDEKMDVVDPDYVVNAAGPWAGEVAAMAGIDVPLGHVQRAMVVTERTGLETVVHRCRPDDRAAVVPFGRSSVVGTRDRPVDGPDDRDRTDADVDPLIDDLGAVVPEVAMARPYRAFWGVRAHPPDDAGESASADVPSVHFYDHETRDGCWGITTVHGGPLTVSRHTAEQVADHVCAKFGIDRPCETAQTELPAVLPEAVQADPGNARETDPVCCLDMGVRASQVRAVIADDEVPARGDLRAVLQRTRAAMGACQGGRCAHRLGGVMHPEAEAADARRSVRDLLDGRWAGLRHVLWGEQFATAARTYHLQAGIMNRDGQPGPTDGPIDFAAFDDGTGGDEGGDWEAGQAGPAEEGPGAGRPTEGQSAGTDTEEQRQADGPSSTRPPADGHAEGGWTDGRSDERGTGGDRDA